MTFPLVKPVSFLYATGPYTIDLASSEMMSMPSDFCDSVLHDANLIKQLPTVT